MLDENEQMYLERLAIRFQDLSRKVQNLNLETKKNLPPSLLGQYSGKPIPSTEGVEIDIDYQHDNYEGIIQLEADGYFIAQRIHFAWMVLEDDHWFPAAAWIGDFIPIASSGVAFGNYFNTVNFYWEYRITGSHADRQNIPVGSAAAELSGRGYGSWPLYSQDPLPPASVIKIKITMLPMMDFSQDPPVLEDQAPGRLYCGFHGCYVFE